MSLWTKEFVEASLERAISTAAQSAIGVLSGAAVAVSIGAINWTEAAVTVGVATLLSILKSIAANTSANPGPSIGGLEKLKVGE